MKAKLRKVGNSLGILIPKEAILGYKAGDEIDIDIITRQTELCGDTPEVITSNMEFDKCPKCNELICEGKCLYCGTEICK